MRDIKGSLLCLAKIELVSNGENVCLSCRPFRLTDKIIKSSISSESQWNSVRKSEMFGPYQAYYAKDVLVPCSFCCCENTIYFIC